MPGFVSAVEQFLRTHKSFYVTAHSLNEIPAGLGRTPLYDKWDVKDHWWIIFNDVAFYVFIQASAINAKIIDFYTRVLCIGILLIFFQGIFNFGIQNIFFFCSS